jgi:dynactin 1
LSYNTCSTSTFRLRDVTTEQEAELDRKIKALEKDSIQLEELKGKHSCFFLFFSHHGRRFLTNATTHLLVQHEIVKEKLDLAENQIEDLKIRLDDVIGAEDLVVQLTEKNLNLNEVCFTHHFITPPFPFYMGKAKLTRLSL